MRSFASAACVLTVVASLFCVQACTRQLRIDPPAASAVESFLPEKTFQTDTAQITIFQDGISELTVTDVVALEKELGNALVSFVYTAAEGSWRLSGRLIYKMTAGRTECQFIEFNDAIPLDAAVSGTSEEGAESTESAQ